MVGRLDRAPPGERQRHPRRRGQCTATATDTDGSIASATAIATITDNTLSPTG